MISEGLKKQISVFLTFVIFIDFMGVATVVTLFPHLLLSANGMFSNAITEGNKLILMGIFLAIYPLGQFFGASALGKLSDYYGRKKILIITLVGTFVGFLGSAISVEISSAALLFVSRLLAGLSAGNVSVAQASLLDISTAETKSRYVSYGQMAMGSAYIVGPVIGAWLSQSTVVSWFNESTPFWFFSAILIVLLIITFTTYQETQMAPKREKINLLQGFQQIYQALGDKKLNKAFLVWLVFVSGWWLFESFMPTFLLQNFHFTTVQIGNLLAFNGALYAAFQYLIVQKVAKKMSPVTMARISIGIAGIAIISIGIAHNTFQLYMGMIAFVLTMGFSIPGIITHIANMAGDKDQGQAMGMVNSIQAFATVLVMLLGGYINSINSHLSVIAGGAVVILSWLIFIAYFSIKKMTNHALDITNTAI